jgi:Ca-activated chloride channel homolog
MTNAHSKSFVGKLALLLTVMCLGACLDVAGQTPNAEQPQPRSRLVGPPPPPPVLVSAASSRGEEVNENDVLRVDTQLISVPVVVRDQQGRQVTGLTASAFQLYEDGLPQRVAIFAAADTPFEIALFLDTSGSTRADIELIRSAASAFIESLRPGDRVAVLSFATTDEGGERRATVAVQSYLTADRQALREALQNIRSSSGTPYYDAVERTVNDIFHDSPAPELQGRRALVALTDGVDSSSRSDFASIRARLLDAGLLAYFVEVDTEDYVEDRLLIDCDDDRTLRLSRAQLERYRRIFDPRADGADYADFCRLGGFQRMAINRSLYKLAREEMGRLARETGGRTFQATSLDAARDAFAEVAAEIGRQYSIGYYSTNRPIDGRFRKIRVDVQGIAGAQVSAREGYTTSQH